MTVRRAPLLWATAALVALFELGAASLILRHDGMPAAYRAYYVDKTSDCWRHVTAGDYQLGTTLSFVSTRGPLFFPNKVCGWFYPTETGTWSYGRFSLLRFVFTPVNAPLTLRFAAGAMVDDDEPTQPVLVSANGHRLATLSFSDPQADIKEVDIPANLAQTGRIEIRFDYPGARPGTELGPNEDPHLRAIRMVALTLNKG